MHLENCQKTSIEDFHSPFYTLTMYVLILHTDVSVFMFDTEVLDPVLGVKIIC